MSRIGVDAGGDQYRCSADAGPRGPSELQLPPTADVSGAIIAVTGDPSHNFHPEVRQAAQTGDPPCLRIRGALGSWIVVAMAGGLALAGIVTLAGVPSVDSALTAGPRLRRYRIRARAEREARKLLARIPRMLAVLGELQRIHILWGELTDFPAARAKMARDGRGVTGFRRGRK
jgi:hypothetical protein